MKEWHLSLLISSTNLVPVVLLNSPAEVKCWHTVEMWHHYCELRMFSWWWILRHDNNNYITPYILSIVHNEHCLSEYRFINQLWRTRGQGGWSPPTFEIGGGICPLTVWFLTVWYTSMHDEFHSSLTNWVKKNLIIQTINQLYMHSRFGMLKLIAQRS